MSSLYRELIIDRYKAPLFKGKLDSPDIFFHDANPLCGDEVSVYVKLDENKNIKEAKFEGSGCAISQASIDLVLEDLQGANISEVLKLDKDYIMELLNIPLTPVRLKCALLGLKVLQAGILVYMKKQENDQE